MTRLRRAITFTAAAILLLMSVPVCAVMVYYAEPEYLEGDYSVRAAVTSCGPAMTDDVENPVRIGVNRLLPFQIYFYNDTQHTLVQPATDIDEYDDPYDYYDTLMVEWDFGDGTPVVQTEGTAPSLRHAYSAIGVYTVHWKIRDLHQRYGSDIPDADDHPAADAPDPENWDAEGDLHVQVVDDASPPDAPSVTDDGEFTTSTTTLHATWSAQDLQSGIRQYVYAIGTTPGGGDISTWRAPSPANATEVTRTDLHLTSGTTCFFSVYAYNGMCQISDMRTSDGIAVDFVAPVPGTASAPASEDSGVIAVSYTGASDEFSGLRTVELWYRKGPAGTWTNSGYSGTSAAGSFTFPVTEQDTYYFDLVAEDNAGNRSDPPSGDGDCRTIFEAGLGDVSGRTVVHNEYQYAGGPLLRTSVYDPSGVVARQTTNSYGDAGELLGVSGSAESVMYGYDAAYRVTGITDGEGNQTSFIYDDDGDPSTDDAKAGILTRIEYPGGGVAQFTEHDPAGRVLTSIDPNGLVTRYDYADPEGLLTSVTYPDRTVITTYDSVYGLPTQISNITNSGTTLDSRTFAYDNTDLVTTETTAYSGMTGEKSIGYQYWPDGSLELMTTPAGNFQLDYDAVGRVSQLINPYGSTFGWTYRKNAAYESNGWLESWESPVSTTSFDQNARGLLTSLVNRKKDVGQTVLSSYTIASDTGYDAVGNLLSMTADVPGADAGFSGLTTYGYDNRDQLLSEQSARNGGYNWSFEYDNAGNNTTLRGVSDRQFNANNQNSAFSYNDNGNPTLYNGVSPAYNEDDQLTAFGSMTAGYRSDGLRAWRDSGTGRRYFLYAGTTPVCELNADGSIAAVNTFGPTGLLSRRENGQDRFYTFDPQGSVSRILDSTGSVSATQLYDAYGTLLHGTASYPYGFGAQYGYYTDQETNLLLLTHRYYDPSEARFLTRDPIGYAGGMNLYAYCGNNPVNAVDPLGFCGDRTAASPPTAGGFPVGPKGILPNFLREANPFNRNSALFRQGISIGDFFRGDWRGAAANSGHAMMEESNCSKAEFVAYAGTQAAAGAAAIGAAGIGAVGLVGSLSASSGTAAAEVVVGTGGPGVVYQFLMNGQTYIGRTIDYATRSTYWIAQGAQNIAPVGVNLTYDEMRGLEQLMIEINGGIASPNVMNVINGVAAANPNYSTYINAAWQLF